MNKILSEKNFTKIKTRIKKLKVGLCHGVFDILHKGHIDHFKEAKKNCDILIVSVTENKFIDKGPNQPINNMKNRMDLLTNLTDIDFVIPSKAALAPVYRLYSLIPFLTKVSLMLITHPFALFR